MDSERNSDRPRKPNQRQNRRQDDRPRSPGRQVEQRSLAKAAAARFVHPLTGDIAIKMEGVSKTFEVRDNAQNTIHGRILNVFAIGRKRTIAALKKLDITIYKGEVFGIIGRNGSGKSTLIHLMTGAYTPDAGGKVTINGKFMRMSLGMGFNKELSARENIYINCSVLGMPIAEIDNKFNEIMAFSELSDFVDTKVKYFSKGMVARLSFAIAIHARADIFLMDEFFGGVGDEGFKKKADEEFKKAFLNGRTIVHVSHSLETIRKYCNRVLLLDKGSVLGIGTPDEIIPMYRKLFNEGPGAE